MNGNRRNEEEKAQSRRFQVNEKSGWVGADEGGLWWVKVDEGERESGWKWVRVGEDEWDWVGIDEGRWKWERMRESGWEWVRVDEGGWVVEGEGEWLRER